MDEVLRGVYAHEASDLAKMPQDSEDPGTQQSQLRRQQDDEAAKVRLDACAEDVRRLEEASCQVMEEALQRAPLAIHPSSIDPIRSMLNKQKRLVIDTQRSMHKAAKEINRMTPKLGKEVRDLKRRLQDLQTEILNTRAEFDAAKPLKASQLSEMRMNSDDPSKQTPTDSTGGLRGPPTPRYIPPLCISTAGSCRQTAVPEAASPSKDMGDVGAKKRKNSTDSCSKRNPLASAAHGGLQRGKWHPDCRLVPPKGHPLRGLYGAPHAKKLRRNDDSTWPIMLQSGQTLVVPEDYLQPMPQDIPTVASIDELKQMCHTFLQEVGDRDTNGGGEAPWIKLNHLKGKIAKQGKKLDMGKLGYAAVADLANDEAFAHEFRIKPMHDAGLCLVQRDPRELGSSHEYLG